MPWVPAGKEPCKLGSACERNSDEHFERRSHPSDHPKAVRDAPRAPLVAILPPSQNATAFSEVWRQVQEDVQKKKDEEERRKAADNAARMQLEEERDLEAALAASLEEERLRQERENERQRQERKRARGSDNNDPWTHFAEGIGDEAKLRALLAGRQPANNISKALTIDKALKIDCQSQLERFESAGFLIMDPKEALRMKADTILLHGSPQMSVANIAMEGLSVNNSSAGQLGRGIYGAPDPRKANQFALQNHHGSFIFVIRVNLSHAKYLQGPPQPGGIPGYEEFCVPKDSHAVVLWQIKLDLPGQKIGSGGLGPLRGVQAGGVRAPGPPAPAPAPAPAPVRAPAPAPAPALAQAPASKPAGAARLAGGAGGVVGGVKPLISAPAAKAPSVAPTGTAAGNVPKRPNLKRYVPVRSSFIPTPCVITLFCIKGIVFFAD